MGLMGFNEDSQVDKKWVKRIEIKEKSGLSIK